MIIDDKKNSRRFKKTWTIDFLIDNINFLSYIYSIINMIATIRKYKFVFSVVVICFLNFYFFSPFIHDHPVVVQGQLEKQYSLHSHLENILEVYSNSSNSISEQKKSHSHKYIFDIPISCQNIQKIKHISTSCYHHFDYELSLEFNKRDKIRTFPKLFIKDIWEKYVHFGSNSSPPDIGLLV